jgi:FtsP/CotA-like multicopper oxidase with cupredoxin domain
MRTGLTRRHFLTSSFATLAANHLVSQHGLVGFANSLPQGDKETPPAPTFTVRAMKRTLEINGKLASAMGLLRPSGFQGITTSIGAPFRVLLENMLEIPTAIHWHGLHPPNNQDGVPGVTQPVIRPNASLLYDFPVSPAGTHWMHSHQELQEAFLLAAPLIVHDAAHRQRDEQEAVIFLSDYSFTTPTEIYAKLRGDRGKSTPAAKSGTMPKMAKPAMAGMSAKMAKAMQMSKPDANDIDYDAYLANDRTLADPEVVRVEKEGRVRLRVINGSSGTNYFLDLGPLRGEVIATDGIPVKPLAGRIFPLAIAQRIDIKLQIPRDGGAFPILALREYATEQTGIVLATKEATIKRLPAKNVEAAGFLTLDMERRFVAAQPLSAKAPDVVSVLRLQGNMQRYEWMINDRAFDVMNPGTQPAGVRVKLGQRVWLKFVNETPMSHPMHLHGHSFQVIAINDVPLAGPIRDTVLVPGKTSVTVALDANNPGLWYVHCHILWHLAAGMATLVQYET